ncbi:MAG: ribosome silencing factor [Candidatus Omnitrophota bacterium]
MNSKEKALFIADLAISKKAEGVVILDVRKISNITNFFIIASASSSKRAQTIVDTVEEGLLKKKLSISGTEGYKEAKWILLDAFDVIMHVFTDELRSFYNLESLWSDARRVRICQRKKTKRSKKTSKRK